MKGYDTWSFRDRTFGTALLVSVFWHFFWFFSMTIVVAPPKTKEKPRPRIVSLGSVLDDGIFKTLIETRPPLSEAFYRRLSEIPETLEPPAQTIERHSPGDVVSVPFGKKFLDAMRMLVSGDKASPEYGLGSRFKIGYAEDAEGLEGEAAGRPLVQRPAEPSFASFGRDKNLIGKETQIVFAVDASGAVRSAAVAESSGNADLDDEWLSYLKSWQFAPLPMGSPDQTGKIRFRLSAAGRPRIDA